MKKANLIFLFGLFPLVATSSHVAYSVIVVVSLWAFFGSYLLGKLLSDLIKVQHEKIFIFFFTIILYCIYVRAGEIFFPIIFASLLPYLYLLGFSYIIYFSLGEFEKTRFPSMLLQYSILCFLISFFRELFAFGSISFPSIYGIASLNIFAPLGLAPPFKFLGSTAGSLIMAGAILSFYFWYSNDEVLYERK